MNELLENQKESEKVKQPVPNDNDIFDSDLEEISAPKRKSAFSYLFEDGNGDMYDYLHGKDDSDTVKNSEGIEEPSSQTPEWKGDSWDEYDEVEEKTAWQEFLSKIPFLRKFVNNDDIEYDVDDEFTHERVESEIEYETEMFSEKNGKTEKDSAVDEVKIEEEKAPSEAIAEEAADAEASEQADIAKTEEDSSAEENMPSVSEDDNIEIPLAVGSAENEEQAEETALDNDVSEADAEPIVTLGEADEPLKDESSVDVQAEAEKKAPTDGREAKKLLIDAQVLLADFGSEPELRLHSEDVFDSVLKEAYDKMYGTAETETAVAEEKTVKKTAVRENKLVNKWKGFVVGAKAFLSTEGMTDSYETEDKSEIKKSDAVRKTKEVQVPVAVTNNHLNTESVIDDKARLKSEGIAQLVRMMLCGTIAILLIVLSLFSGIASESFALSQKNNGGTFILLNMIGMIASTVVSLPTVTVGFASMLSKENKDSAGADRATAIAAVMCVLQSVTALVRVNENVAREVMIVAPIGALILWFNAWGKFLILRRTSKNLHWLSKRAIYAVETEDGPSNTVLASLKKVGRTDRFVADSLEFDISERTVNKLHNIGLIISAVCAIVIFIRSLEITTTLSVLAVGCCLTAPATALLTVGLPLSRVCKRLRRIGAVITSWNSINQLGDVDRITLRDSDLLPKGGASLRQIKIFGNGRVEEIVPSAEALVRNAGGPIADVLADTVHESNRIADAEYVEYEKGGIVGWINGRRVMLGNRVLLERHGVDLPSREYEQQNYPSGQNVLYFADGGELMAAFLVEYLTSEKIESAVRSLSAYYCDFDVCSYDGSITSSWLRDLFGLPEDAIRVTPEMNTDEEKVSRSDNILAAVSRRGFPLLKILLESIRLKQHVSLAMIMQTACMFVGLLILLIFCISNGFLKLDIVHFLVYQAIWIIAILLLPVLRR